MPVKRMGDELSKVEERTLQEGLSSYEVEERVRRGQVNKRRRHLFLSLVLIVLKNLFSWFNLVLFGVAIAFVCLGVGIGQSPYSWSKYAFLIPVVINLAIGIYQEIQARRTLEKLDLAKAPSAKVVREGKIRSISAEEIVLGDVLVVERGMSLPVDGTIGEGSLTVDESMLTGESKERTREAGANLMAGTLVLEGRALLWVTAVGKDTYADRMKGNLAHTKKPKGELVNGVQRIVFVLSLLILPFAAVTGWTAFRNLSPDGFWNAQIAQGIAVEVGTTIVGAIPTGLVLLTSTRCALSILSLYKKKTSIRELKAVEGLALARTVCMDKTGTLTTGRMVYEGREDFAKDQDVCGRLKGVLDAVPDNTETIQALRGAFQGCDNPFSSFGVIPFNSKIKHSGCSFQDDPEASYLLGAPSFLLDHASQAFRRAEEKAKKGVRVLAFARREKRTGKTVPLCLLFLSEELRKEVKDALKGLEENQVCLVLLSGDDPLTVKGLAVKAGWDESATLVDLTGADAADVERKVEEGATIFGRATPEQKKAVVEATRRRYGKVAMVIDGLNDLLASKASDCSIAVAHPGASGAVGLLADVTLLDGNFAHLSQIIKEGRKSVSDMERSSTLFLMKSLLALGLSAFSPLFGHLPYSIEGLYLMTWFVTGMAGFFLGLEENSAPVKGRFLSNVLSSSLPPGCFLLLSVLLVQLLTLWGGIPYALVQPRYGAVLPPGFPYPVGATLSFSEHRDLLQALVLRGGMDRDLFLKNVLVLEEPIAIVASLIAGFTVLIHSALPMNKYRLLSLGFALFCCLFWLSLLPNYFLGVDSLPADVRGRTTLLFGADSSLYWIGRASPGGGGYLLALLVLSYPLAYLFCNVSDVFFFHVKTRFSPFFPTVPWREDDSIKKTWSFLAK